MHVCLQVSISLFRSVFAMNENLIKIQGHDINEIVKEFISYFSKCESDNTSIKL